MRHEDWIRLIDLGFFGVLLSTIVGILPSITALATLTWVVMRIYQTRQEMRKTALEIRRLEMLP